MESLGKVLVVVGAVVLILGLLMQSGAFRNLPLGKLPGDVFIQRDGFTFAFPFMTMLLASGVLTLIAWLAGALRR